jgi:pyridoxine 5-phosphate synthase
VREINIGHFLVGEAIFIGLEAATGRMRAEMDKARATAVEAGCCAQMPAAASSPDAEG